MFTYILAAVNVIVFILIRLSKLDPDDLAVSYHKVYNLRQYYRIVTAAFTHVDFLHLFFNVSSLINVGTFVESYFGPFRMIVIYLAAMIPGKILSLQIRHGMRDDYSESIGASTAICGLLGAYFMVILYFLGLQSYSYLIRPMASLLMMSFLPGVDGTSHFCGMAAGMAVTFLLLKVL